MGVFKIERVVSYYTHKRGESYEDIQDSIAIDQDNGRFALSDGVSNSLLPKIWSELLVEEYLKIDNTDKFPTSNLTASFDKRVEIYSNSLNDEQKMLLQMVVEEYKVAGATFVGINILQNKMSWQVIGDSCLFFLPEDDKLQVFSSVHSFENEEGYICMEFNNTPSQLLSDGEIIGEILRGKNPLQSGWIALMSDAMSEWFVNQYNIGNNPINRLLDIESNGAFEAFVEEECNADRLKSDDESIILIRVSKVNDIDSHTEEQIKPCGSEIVENKEISFSFKSIKSMFCSFIKRGN